MVSLDPKSRPSVGELMVSKVFQSENRSVRSYSLPAPQEGECMSFLTIVGRGDRWKQRYIRFGKENLLAYKNKEDTKAKFCYAFKDCKIAPLANGRDEVTERAESTQEENKQPYSAKRHVSLGTDCDGRLKPAKLILKVEHRELETLYLRVESDIQMKMVRGITFADSLGHSSMAH